VGRRVGAERDRLAERDPDVAAEGLAGLEGDAHRDEDEGRPAPRGLVVERDARGTGPDPLDAALGMGRALRVDADEPSALEGPEAGGERVRVAIHLAGIVLLAVDGDRPAGGEEAGHQGIAEQGRGRQVVDLPREDAADQQGVDQVVRVVDAEEHGARGRHQVRPDNVDVLEEEPEPEPANPTDHRIKPIALHCARYRMSVPAKVAGLSTGLRTWCSASIPRKAGAESATATTAPASASATEAARRLAAMLGRQVAGPDALHPGLRHLVPRPGQRAVALDAAAGVLDHE